jgi:DNA polymerase I
LRSLCSCLTFRDMNARPQLYLIDGASYIYRAFYAIRHLSNSRGFPTNAIYGFIQMLLKVLKEHKPDYLGVVLDAKGPTFRSELYQAYKANRTAMPDSLSLQVPYIKTIIHAYGIATVEIAGYEADDLIGTIARQACPEADVVVITGDKDILQLVTERICVYDTMKEKRFGVDEVIQRFGVRPEQLTDVMGLSGDAIDNIPGVPGIGEKTAIELIKAFGGVENLLGQLDRVPRKGVKEKLELHGDLARLSRQLATIRTDVAFPFQLEHFAIPSPDYAALRSLFQELEFTKLIKDLPADNGPDPEPSPVADYRLVCEEGEFLGLLDDLKRAAFFSLDVKTTSPYPVWADLVAICVSCRPGQGFYIPVGPQAASGIHLSIDWVLDHLRPVLESPEVKKRGRNAKHALIVLKRYGIDLRGVECDIRIASYVLNPTRHSHDLPEIARDHLGRTVTPYKDVVGTGTAELAFEARLEKIRDCCCEEVDLSLQLSDLLLPKIAADGLHDLYSTVEMPLISVLAKMECHGVKIDAPLLTELSKDLKQKLDGKIDLIYSLAGETFNINSPQQLGRVLFEKLKLPTLKKTKTGYSTDVDVLTKLSLQHALPLEILSYRNLSKLKSTYIDSLPTLIHPRTGRVHTSYHQTVTATGRLSSSDPNLQNIPVRSEEENGIRRAFIAEGGCLLASADYSQIELRVLAHLSRDSVLVGAFAAGEDVHARTASEVFHISMEEVTSAMRRQAKVINFGILYGMSAYGLSQQLGIEPKLAQDYIDAYFEHYGEVRAYTETILEDARRKGYVTTLFGRRRYLPEINSPAAPVRQASERMAINTPIQGTAADIIKVAMIRIQDRLETENFSTRMIMQVHDELVFEIPEAELADAVPLIRNEMESVIELSVPLTVSLHWGRNWAEAH